MKSRRKASHQVCIIIFPMLNRTFELIKDVDSFENRQPANQPSFNISNLDPFPNAFESFKMNKPP